jgi:small-conductance mechanosensitive channel
VSSDEALITIGTVTGAVFIFYLLWRFVLRRFLPERVGEVINKLVPALILVVLLTTGLLIIDPDQADTLFDATLRYIPRAFVAVIVVVVASALGEILGEIVDSAVRPMSPVMAARAGLVVKSVVVAVGVIIVLQHLGVSADIILILSAAVAFGAALTIALLIGLGGVPVARQVAAGRHVQERYETGQIIRVGDVEGRIVSIGLSTTRLEAMDGGFVEIPNQSFLEQPIIRQP